MGIHDFMNHDVFIVLLFFHRVDELQMIWNSWWHWFPKPIHAVANVLHHLWHSEDQHACNELEGFMSYVEKWTSNNVDMQRRIEDDLLVFRNHSSHFGRPIAKLGETQLQPAVSWWEKYGNCTPTLVSNESWVTSMIHNELWAKNLSLASSYIVSGH